MKELIEKIEQWSEDRNIFNGSTVQKQIFKLAEEIGELFSGHNKNDLDLIKDSVGDCVVVLVNLRKMLNYKETIYDTYLGSEYIHNIPTENFNADESLAWVQHFVGQLSDYSLPEHEEDADPETVNMVFYNLMRYCRAKDIDIVGCTRFAYNQIKHRKGKMIDQIWIKEGEK